jgi:hypothetical protein
MIRCRRLVTWIATMLLATGLAGCTDALTVWPVAGAVRGNAPVEVPSLSGRWRLAGEDEDGPILDVKQVPGDRGICRAGMVTYTESGNVTQVGDETCFLDIAGYTVAEVRSVEPKAGFYRQYLVRLQSERIEVCTGFPVWVLLLELQKGGGAGFALESLDYTLRERESGDLMVFISRPVPMLEFLATALPEAAAACDQNDEGVAWIAFERAEEENDGEQPAP